MNDQPTQNPMTQKPECIHIEQWALDDKGNMAWEFHVWGADDEDPLVCGTRPTLVQAIEATLQFVRSL